jgi:hypothetical protein
MDVGKTSASAKALADKPDPGTNTSLDVYLVPIGREQWECYYEAIDRDEEVERGAGFFAGLRYRFQQQLKEAENARHQAAIEQPKTFLGRMHKRVLAWIAERIAEQRLLWHLRRADSATLHVPADLAPEDGERIMREIMKRDADRHRNRLIPHTLLFILSGLVAVVPGPNLLAYLLTFTVVGHFLSWRGAVHALHGVAWTVAPTPALADLRRAFTLADAERHRVIKEIAHRLHMPKMARFVEQMSAAGA